MNILVTGGAGFIGSHIVDDYISRGHRILIVDDMSSGYKLNINPRASFSKLDIRNRMAVSRFFKNHRIDIVNHHAAQIDVRRSVTNPERDAQTNIMGFLNLLEASRDHHIKRFIFASSGGTIYGECKKPATENDPEVPLSPYGVAKLAAEKYLKAFSALFRLDFTILRYSNVYGPRQDPKGEAGVVAIFSRCLIRNKKPIVFGTGQQTRDYVFVKDVARANGLALTLGRNQVINISTGKETSVNQLYSMMADRHGSSLKPQKKPARSGELFRSVLSCRQANQVLRWKPSVSLSEGLKQTLTYFYREM